MAPEQLHEPKQVDGRADIYALGRALYYLLTGEVPNSSPRLPPVVREDMPAGLADVLSKMVAEAPAGRYPSAAAVVEAISSFCDGFDLARHGEAVRQAIHAAELESEPKPDELDFLWQLEVAPNDSGLESGRMINVPGPPTEFFTGRAEEIALCHDILASDGRAVLFGPGGIGKTETALAYTHK